MTLAAAPPTPLLGPHQLLVFLLQVGALLLLALLLGRLALRARLPAVVGELAAGVLLGPSLFGRLAPGVSGWLLPASPEQMHLLDAIGQLGVLLLVGVTGAHLDLSLVRRKRSTAVRVSLCGLLVPLVLGVAVGLLLPGELLGVTSDRTTFAAFLGVAMCVSAVPVIAKTLSDMNLLHRDVGQLILTAGMVDDAVGWFLLSIVSAMAVGGLSAGTLTLSALHLVGFVLAAVLLGRPLVRWAFRRSPEPGVSTAVAVVTVLGGAALTQSLGLEAVFGAFVAGVLVGAPGVVPASRLAGLRTVVMWVLAPVFLATAGLRMDLGTLADPLIGISALAVLAIATVGKFGGAYAGARWSRLSRREGFALGAGMNARGVVEIVVAMVGLRLGVLTTATYTIVVLVAIGTSVMAPPLLRAAMAGVDDRPDERLRATAQAEWLTGTTRSALPADGG